MDFLVFWIEGMGLRMFCGMIVFGGYYEGYGGKVDVEELLGYYLLLMRLFWMRWVLGLLLEFY